MELFQPKHRLRRAPCVFSKSIVPQVSNKLASRSSGNEFVFGAGGMKFKSPADQIGRSVANGSLPL